MDHTVLLVLVAVGLLSLASQWLAWSIRVPAILFLLASGILLGPVTGWLEPDALFGDLFFPFVSLSVAVILFEGSLTLRRDEIEGHGSVVRNLVSFGVLVTWFVVTAATYWIVGVNWQVALLFGAIMTVTGPTVIMPMIQAVRPNANVANILRWEGILIDPIGAILAVLTFNVILATRLAADFGEVAFVVFKLLAAGLVFGSLAGWAWGVMLRRYWVPQFLHNVATLLIVFAVYAAADLVEGEAGLLAVTVMGIWLANMRGVHIDEILDFKESLSLLLISGLFILLAARLEFAELVAVGWPALLVLLAIQFVARPLKVFLCSLGSPLSGRERALLAWIGPRGIVAAAISAVFALRLDAQGFADADVLVPLTFVVIVGTVVLQSLTAGPLAKLLDVAEPPREGVLIVGANRFSIELAKVMAEAGFRIILADRSWEAVRPARMEGVDTYFGNATSDHAERTMDLAGIGRVFAMSRHPGENHLVCAHFAGEFGRKNVYALPVSIDEAAVKPDKHAPAAGLRGRRLFGKGTSLSRFLSEASRGAQIRTTPLSESFGWEDYLAANEGHREPLVAWNDKGRLVPFSVEDEWEPEAGWTVAGMHVPPAATEAEEAVAKQAEAAAEADNSGQPV